MSGKNSLIAGCIVALIIGSVIGYFCYPAPKKDVAPGPSPYNQPTQPTQPAQNYATKEQVDGVITLVYGAIGASLVAALASIVCLMQVSKTIGGRY